MTSIVETSYIYLVIAVISEVIATTSLKAADEFSRLWPSVLVVAGYASAFWFLSLTLRTLPVGIVYAIWASVGVGVSPGRRCRRGHLQADAGCPAIAGMVLIVAGLVVINLFSKSVPH